MIARTPTVVSISFVISLCHELQSAHRESQQQMLNYGFVKLALRFHRELAAIAAYPYLRLSRLRDVAQLCIATYFPLIIIIIIKSLFSHIKNGNYTFFKIQ